MTTGELGRWALVGTAAAGRFLLERFCVRPDFPLAAVCVLPQEDSTDLRTYSLPVVTELTRLMEHPDLTGVVITAQRQVRRDLIQTALAAGKRVLVEGDLGLSVADSLPLLTSADDRLSVFQLRRPDQGFLTARTVARHGRLGPVHTVRYLSCEVALPDSQAEHPAAMPWQQTLWNAGLVVFDELQQLLPGLPVRVTAWSHPLTAGFQARFDYPQGTSASVDLQRMSPCGLNIGWVLEGENGAYSHRRLMTRASDGEIASEELTTSMENEEDVMTELRRLALDPRECRDRLVRAIRSTALCEAIETSIGTGESVVVE